MTEEEIVREIVQRIINAKPLPRGAVAKVMKGASKRHGGYALGRNLYLFRQNFHLFGICADRTSEVAMTNLTYVIESSCCLQHGEAPWLWCSPEGLPVEYDAIDSTIDSMVSKFDDEMQQFSAVKHIADERKSLSWTVPISFYRGFTNAVLTFIFDLGDPAEWLTLGIAGAKAAIGQPFRKASQPFIAGEIETGTRALTALSDGCKAFKQFLIAEEAACLTLLSPKRPSALLDLPASSRRLLHL